MANLVQEHDATGNFAFLETIRDSTMPVSDVARRGAGESSGQRVWKGLGSASHFLEPGP